jgi:hypothetical protein
LYLVLIQAADILPNLYRTVLIPPPVKAELARANTPAIVRAWISKPPPWLEVVSLKLPVDSALAQLDAAERETISLASELQANPSVDGRTRRCDYSSASWIESGRRARIVGHCCSPRTRRVANHVRTVARDHVPATGSAHGEHARAGCRTQETPGRPTVDRRGDKLNLSTIRRR